MNRRHQNISIKVVNNPTVLVRVIQVIKRRRINISKLAAEDEGICTANIYLTVYVNDEESAMVRKQIEKLVDVMTVNLKDAGKFLPTFPGKS